MSLDQVFLVISLSTYAVSALALVAYFFSRDSWLKNLAVPLVIVGCACQFAQLIARYELTHIWPLLNLYGSLSLFSAMSVAIFIFFAFRYRLWFAGGFVVALAAIFLAYGLTWNEGSLPPVPSLQSYWAKIHVPIVVSSYAAFMVASVISGIYLIKNYLGARPGRGQLWLNTIPSLAQLDVLTYRIVAVGLPLLTVGIITGAWWAKEAWGAYWQWDPKETAALSLWIFYAAYMHLHTRNAFRGTFSAWLGLLGFPLMLFVFLIVNIVIGGPGISLHSYKM
ncbi:MAG: c-type cytochrome biogenesis protein CcsB [Candidatus Meridianibacter frigidus]|nr:MAG: c-type cytochrome biogenesis protein CcsB [Candidatus Eremiobacteraeota bacterium]